MKRPLLAGMFALLAGLMATGAVFLILKKASDPFENVKNSPNQSAGEECLTEVIPDSLVTVAFLTGRFNPSADGRFDLVDEEYASRQDIYLQKETYRAFIKMYYAALTEGVKLRIISGTRNFNYQKMIWEQKWNGTRMVDGKNLATSVKDPVQRAFIILKYSSMPGTSRHHWGTDVDLNSMENSYFDKPEGKRVYNWLSANAARYGFCQPFNSREERSSGYEEEKWHWSYLPLSEAYQTQYAARVKYRDIKGFAGDFTADSCKVIENYVGSVSTHCQSKTESR